MSPPSVRRHRAERLLGDQFEALRGEVLRSVRGRLRASGVYLDRGDLEAAYSQAWQGLYMGLLEGREIVNPAGWLTLVAYRRALDEHRGRTRSRCHGELHADCPGGAEGTSGRVRGRSQEVGGIERDLAAELDERASLRQLFEGLRARLDPREREAAALCYLQGLSRRQAAAQMGISEARMRKLMEGRGRGRPGVARKVGALVETIREGGWCEEQGSLMRALAYGVLDPAGERHLLALAHADNCPACRAYVVSLRGLSAALPPAFLPGGACAAVLARACTAAHGAGSTGCAGAGAGLAGAGRGIGATVSASGAAGAGGGATGGWLIGAGPFGAKLAVGCLLALGVGAGCVVVEGGHTRVPHRDPRPSTATHRGAATITTRASYVPLASDVRARAPGLVARGGAVGLTPASRVSREFGPERALAPGGATALSARAARAHPKGREAGSGHPRRGTGGSSGAGETGAGAPSPGGDPSPTVGAPVAAGDSPTAEREFSPG
jgi:DNA-directed RNA polymerase specialized sigma24 family protein